MELENNNENLPQEEPKLFFGGCTGPSIKDAYRRGEEAFEEIIKLLETKYYLNSNPCDLPHGMSQMLKKEWYEKKEELKKAIQEMFWIDDCDSF